MPDSRRANRPGLDGPSVATEGRSGGDLVFVGDVHLDRGDPALPDFLEFLTGLAGSCRRLVLLGDLFNLWLGSREIEQPHQAAVVERLGALRRAGVVVRYVEGNRDYHIARAYAGTAFDDVTRSGLEERWGGSRVWAIHGDLANPRDRQYRAWRAFSRGRWLWWLYGRLPGRTRLGLAESLERRMRSSNVAFKRAFPEADVRAYGIGFLKAGVDAVVLGHFHTERELSVPPGPGSTGARRVFVLPEWRESRRHLRVAPDGAIGFVDSGPPPPVP